MNCSLKNIYCLILILFYIGNTTTVAQSFPPQDTSIQDMVKEVNADSLKAYINKLVSFGTRQTLSSITNPVRGIGAARNWALHRMEKYAQQSHGRMTVKLDEWMQEPAERIPSPHNIGNILATLKGTDPNDDRVYIVSGHLDSRCTNIMDSVGDAPGADDDGSGVAAVLEMARVMSNRSFKATIIFMLVSGEEQGLYGSEHMAKEAKQENMHIDAMLNNDIIGACNASETGNIDNTKVRVFSEGIPTVEMPERTRMRRLTNGDNDSKSRELARYLSAIAREYVSNLHVTLIYRPDRFLRGGDQMPFQQQGYTAVRITEYNENFYHQHQDVRVKNGIQYGDIPRFMNFDYLRKNTCLNLATLASLANAPSEPQDVKISVSALSNDSKLYWRPPAFGITSGYYILMRETDASMWQQHFFTTDTSITLPYSKDNYFFGVQSVGINGLRSLPVFPDIGK